MTEGMTGWADDDDIDAEGEVGDLSSVAMFEGDTGTLTLEQRRCLVALLKNTVITAPANPRDWDTLVADERIIRSRLNDLLLDLVLDLEHEVAYKVQVRQEGLPVLLRDASYTREETVLLVFLRDRYVSERSAGGDLVFVDHDECLDQVASFRPANSTDVVGDRNRAANAIERLKASSILLKSGQEDRHQISPVIEVVLSINELQSLKAWLREQNRPVGPRDETGDASIEGDSHD